MSVYYDLHIHSCLSPCASDDMTPANIAAMAHLKGLSLISLTDHNAGDNLAVMSVEAEKYGLVFVPGIEVTSREEVHVLAYFPETGPAVEFAGIVYDSLPCIGNRPDIFGNQIIMGGDDRATGTLGKLLLQASAFSLEEIVRMVKQAGGCSVPAHINRDSFSVFANLGFMPPNLFKCVEVSKNLPCPPLDPGLKVLHSSDAHYLGDISEPQNSLPDITDPQSFITYLDK